MSEPIPVRKGDLFVDTEALAHPLYIAVTRVARDGSWADLTFQTWAVHWKGRQALPLPESAVRRDWTEADIDRDAAAALAEPIGAESSKAVDTQ